MEVFENRLPSRRENVDRFINVFCGFACLLVEGFDEFLVEGGNGSAS